MNLKSKNLAVRVNLKSKNLAVKKFREADKATVTNMIGDMLLQSNFRGEGCCYWHIGLQSLLEHTLELLARQCKVGMCPYSAWQCEFCLALHGDSETDYCGVCFSDVIDIKCKNLSEGVLSGNVASSENADISAQSDDFVGKVSMTMSDNSKTS